MRRSRPCTIQTTMAVRGQSDSRRYLLYASEKYAPAILRPLQAAIRARGQSAAWFFDGPGADYLHEDEPLLRTVSEVQAFAPQAVLVPGNRVPAFFPGRKVEVFHGFSVGKRSEGKGHFRVRGSFDLYCTQGPDTSERFRELADRHGYFEVVETGWPKMDPLFRDGPEPYVRDERPIVLLTSTFTESLSAAGPLFATVRALVSKRRWRWLANFHPKMDPAVVDLYRSLPCEDLEYVDTDDVIALLKAADVMVSDTSSVASEFLLQHRPVVTFRRRVRKPYMLDVCDPADLEAAVERALGHPDDLMDAVRTYADRIHPYRDGRSSERVLDAVEESLSGDAKRLRPKPLNLWRNLQMRRRLSYYRLR